MLASRDIGAALCTQVRYNIFERKAEKSGLLRACQDLGVTLVAHSPLQRGLLTGALGSAVPACMPAVHCASQLLMVSEQGYHQCSHQDDACQS